MLFRQLPTIITLLSLVGAATWASKAYKIVRDEDLLQRDSSITAKFGEANYGIIFKAQSSKDFVCVGEASSSLEVSDSGPDLKFKGSLNLLANNQSKTANFEGQLSFNPLGQMGVSILRFTLDNLQMRGGSTGLDPIVFRAKLVTPAGERDLNFELPGPVEIRSTSEKDLYRLLLPPSGSRITALAGHQGLSPFEIKIVSDKERTSLCNPGKLNAVDLAPLTTTVRLLQDSFLANFLPEISQ